MRPRGSGALFRVPKDTTKPLQYWTAIVELPSHDGTRRRKVVRAKDPKVAAKKLRELQNDLEKTGDMPTASQTLESWLRYWFTNIHALRVRPKTAGTQRGLIENHIIPAIGNIRLDKLTAQNVRNMHQTITSKVQEKGKNKGKPISSTTALQAHRVLSTALRDAEREGRVPRNVATLTDAPKRDRTQLVTLDAEDGVRILLEAAKEHNARMGSRWAAALLTGARQGELLGLEIDRVSDVLDLSWQLQRLTWAHGCSGDCGRVRGTDCTNRKLNAPADWEHRHLTGGLWLSRPKSSAGMRLVPLVDPLRQIIERRIEMAANEPNPHGLVWTAEPKRDRKTGEPLPIDGTPIDPKDDNAAWHALLADAGVKDARLHDARHTTVDLLYEAEVSEADITRIVGHSTVAMSRAYRSRGNDKQIREGMSRMAQLLAH